MTKKIVTLLGVLSLVMILLVPLAEASSVSGIVKDGSAGSLLGGANATFKQTTVKGQGTTGSDGFWSTTVPGDQYYELIYTKSGYTRVVLSGSWVPEPSKDFGIQLLYKPSVTQCKPTCPKMY